MAKRTWHQDRMKGLRKEQEAADRERRREQIRATKQQTARIKKQNDKKK